MPDNFTHRYIALNALHKSATNVADLDAFIWGANGPDPLFCYRVYGGGGKEIRDFGGYLHNHKTGEFLYNLHILADTPVKQSYFQGFLCHYGADSVIHPWVYDHTSPGNRYDISNGHGYLETAIDGYFYKKSAGVGVLSADLYAPKLSDEVLTQICQVFGQAVAKTYGKEETLELWKRAFTDFRLVKKALRGNKTIFGTLEKLGRLQPGYLLSHIQPPTMELVTKENWHDHFKVENRPENMEQMVEIATEKCAIFLQNGEKILKNPENLPKFLEIFGSLSYETGLTTEN